MSSVLNVMTNEGKKRCHLPHQGLAMGTTAANWSPERKRAGLCFLSQVLGKLPLQSTPTLKENIFDQIKTISANLWLSIFKGPMQGLGGSSHPKPTVAQLGFLSDLSTGLEHLGAVG